MFKNLSEEYFWFFTCIVAGLLVLLGAVIYTAVQDARQEDMMKACVAAGKDWVRDFGAYYECK